MDEIFFRTLPFFAVVGLGYLAARARFISAEADPDLPSTLVKLSQASTAYEAALASASRILNMSILDYLK